MAVFAQYSLEMYAGIFLVSWFTLPWKEVDRRHGLVLAFAGGLLAFLVNTIIGLIWYRPRPFVALPPSGVHKLIPYAADSSFPSDHVALGFGFAAGSWGRASRWVSFSIALLTIVVMVARVYVGVHWPTDVLAGVAVGVVAGRVAQLGSGLIRHATKLLLRVFRMGDITR